MVKITVSPSGSICGQPWLDSFLARSTLVQGCGLPPAAETRKSPVLKLGAKMMVSSAAHVAPTPAVVSAIVATVPPLTDIFFSLPSAVKNPIHCPSGEKKGAYAPSVPSIRLSASWSRRRRDSHEFGRPPGVYASRLPSGDSATIGLPIWPDWPKLIPGGGSMAKRIGGCGEAFERPPDITHTVTPVATAATSAAVSTRSQDGLSTRTPVTAVGTVVLVDD